MSQVVRRRPLVVELTDIGERVDTPPTAVGQSVEVSPPGVAADCRHRRRLLNHRTVDWDPASPLTGARSVERKSPEVQLVVNAVEE